MRHTRQSGITLISLMVGLTISMIVVLAMLATYKTTVAIAVDAGEGAKLNGQISTGVLAAEINLQSAGFGADDPAYGTNLVVLTSAAFGDTRALSQGSSAAAGGSGNAVVWDSATTPGGARQCGLLIHPASGGLLYSTASCSAASGWNTINWPSPTVLIQDIATVRISTTTGECHPFGISATTGHLSAVIETTNSNGITTTHSVCLGNFQTST